MLSLFMYMCIALTTAYTVCASKLIFELGSLHIKKSFYFWSYPPFSFFTYIYIKAMNLPIMTINISNQIYEPVEYRVFLFDGSISTSSCGRNFEDIIILFFFKWKFEKGPILRKMHSTVNNDRVLTTRL